MAGTPGGAVLVGCLTMAKAREARLLCCVSLSRRTARMSAASAWPGWLSGSAPQQLLRCSNQLYNLACTQSAVNEVDVYLANVRLPAVGTDLLLTLHVPRVIRHAIVPLPTASPAPCPCRCCIIVL